MSAGGVGGFVDAAAVPVVSAVVSFDDLAVAGLIVVDCAFCVAGGHDLGGLVEGEGELGRQGRGILGEGKGDEAGNEKVFHHFLIKKYILKNLNCS